MTVANYGAMYVDQPNNYIYTSHNGTGAIYRIDIGTGEVVEFVPSGEGVSQNDGARCARAPLNVDYGDAPQGYRVSSPPTTDRATPGRAGAVARRDDRLRHRWCADRADASGDDVTSLDVPPTDDEDAFGPGPIVLPSNGGTSRCRSPDATRRNGHPLLAGSISTATAPSTRPSSRWPPPPARRWN